MKKENWVHYAETMDIGYTRIQRQGKIFRQLILLIWTSFIGQFVHPVIRLRDGVKWVESELVILATCVNHFIRVHYNLVQVIIYQLLLPCKTKINLET